MESLRKIYDGFFKVVEIICISFVIIMIGIVSYMVIMRYIFSNSPKWGDELALFCMVWIGLLSASIALKEDRHIRIKLWEMVLPPKAMKVLEIFVHIIVLVVVTALFKYGYGLIEVAVKTLLPGSGLPLRYLYMSVPVSAFLMMIAAIGRLGEIIGSKC